MSENPPNTRPLSPRRSPDDAAGGSVTNPTSCPDERTHLLTTLHKGNRRSLRPTPWWYIVLLFAIATTSGFTTAPMIALLTEVICDDHQRNGDLPQNIPPEMCATDPKVQAGVSTIIGTQMVMMGTLSCLTAAWWGSLSDRYGRTRVIALCGFPFIDVAYLLLGRYRSAMPGGYRVVLLGYTIQGLVGGMSALLSMMQAYITDCTDDDSRARAFSLFLGALYAGNAVGPTLGSLLVRFTGSSLSVFVTSVSVCMLTSSCSLLVVPEAITAAQMMDARRRYKDATVPSRRGIAWILSPVLTFVRPLGILLPQKDAPRVSGQWNLVLLAAAYGSFNMISSNSQYILQYAGANLHFSVEMMGYAVSIAGASRSLYLALCFPVVLRIFDRVFSALPKHLADSDDHVDGLSSDGSSTVRSMFGLNLVLARASAVFESIIFASFPFVSRSGWFFAAMGAGALGAGFNPAVQSLAVDACAARGRIQETGQLFGALSVVQALCAYIVSPAVFSLVSVYTLATAPAALFFVATAFTSLAFAILGFVREPQARAMEEEVA